MALFTLVRGDALLYYNTYNSPVWMDQYRSVGYSATLPLYCTEPFSCAVGQDGHTLNDLDFTLFVTRRKKL